MSTPTLFHVFEFLAIMDQALLGLDPMALPGPGRQGQHPDEPRPPFLYR